MKILFLTILKIDSLDERGIYNDLLNKFYKEGHEIYIVCPMERRYKKPTALISDAKASILQIRTFNLQKTNVIEKGIGTVAMEYQFLSGIKKYFSNIRFDLVLYSTPPITFSKVINFIKKKCDAFSYLLLKDIFPQNAVDMKMMKENSLLHKVFLKKEKKLYEISDKIGCMSEANKTYILNNNPFLSPVRVEVNPNSILPQLCDCSESQTVEIKKKYEIPLHKKVFVYGGNLGVPQGIDFLLQTIAATSQEQSIFFLIVGAGTEFKKIQLWFKKESPLHALLINHLPKNDYDLLIKACDVGLIFLNRNFTIPNFPSRLLSYLENKMPVIAATDVNTDIGKVIEKAGCGFWVESGDIESMKASIKKIISDEDAFSRMRTNAYNLLIEKYTVDISYQLIINNVQTRV
jgi:glycosyltransferase involved in cell wall biosynthesis